MASSRIVFVLILFLVVCSSSFDTVATGQDLSGHWNGAWQSQTTGHRGRISATFCQIDSCQVQAKFKGTFARIIPFRYRTKLQIVHQEPGLMVLGGSRKLGPIMGQFTYEGTISNGQFSAQYSSKRDRGTWNLSRQR